MSEGPSVRPPEANLPGTDPEFRRPVSWRSAALIIGAALFVPILVGRCVWQGVGGTPSPRVRAVADAVPTGGATGSMEASAVPRRMPLEEIIKLNTEQGRGAAMAAFEQSMLPFQPSPLEWTYYIAMAQDEGRSLASARGVQALSQMSIEPWRLPLLRARQAIIDGDLDRAWRETAQATEHLRASPQEMIPLAEEIMARVAGGLLLAHRPREAAQILAERLVQTRPILSRLRLQALMMSGRAAEAADWLERDRSHFAEGERLRLLAAARWAEGKAGSAATLWEQALNLAVTHGNDAEQLALAVSARLAGDAPRARRAFELAWEGDTGRRLTVEAWTDFLSLLVETEDLSAAAAWAEKIRRRYPISSLARNNAAYLRLVLDLAPAEEIAALLATPEGLGPATVALAKWRQGTLDSLPEPDAQADAATWAVWALWLRSNGRAVEAVAATTTALASPQVTAIERHLLR